MNDTEKVMAVRVALFPEPEPVDTQPGHTVSHDAAENLDAAIYDLKRTGADAGCIRTLEAIAGQMAVAQRVLAAS